MWQINSCSLHEYHLSEVTGSCVVLLPGGADHAGSAAVWWSDSNAARRPAPEYYDPEGPAGSQFQLTDCWQAVSMNDWHLKHCSLMFTVVYCEIPQGFLYMIKSVFSYLRMLKTWHRPCSNRSPTYQAHSSKPTARCCSRQMEHTDRHCTL